MLPAPPSLLLLIHCRSPSFLQVFAPHLPSSSSSSSSSPASQAAALFCAAALSPGCYLSSLSTDVVQSLLLWLSASDVASFSRTCDSHLTLSTDANFARAHWESRGARVSPGRPLPAPRLRAGAAGAVPAETWLDVLRFGELLRATMATSYHAVLAAGNVHSAHIDADGDLLTFGQGVFGQLGHGDKSDRCSPTLVPLFPSCEAFDALDGHTDEQEDTALVQVSAGAWHTAVVDGKGRLFTFGKGELGQLGNGDTKNSMRPAQVRPDTKEPVRFVQVAGGADHTLALTDAGEVYSFGCGWDGQLGHGDRESRLVPARVEALRDTRVVQVAVGTSFSAVLTDHGDVLTFGSGRSRALGHGPDTRDLLVPTRVQLGARAAGGCGGGKGAGGKSEVAASSSSSSSSSSMSSSSLSSSTSTSASTAVALPASFVEAADERIVHIAAGPGHLNMVTVGGSLIACGSNRHGQLGLGAFTGVVPYPTVVIAASPQQPRIVSTEIGHDFMVALRGDGAAMSCGSGHTGCLGQGDPMEQRTAKVIGHLGNHVATATTGHFHSLFLDHDGDIHTCGWGTFGQLGHAAGNQSLFTPQPIVFETDDICEFPPYGSSQASPASSVASPDDRVESFTSTASSSFSSSSSSAAAAATAMEVEGGALTYRGVY